MQVHNGIHKEVDREWTHLLHLHLHLVLFLIDLLLPFQQADG